MEKLLPDQLKELWQCVDRHELTSNEFYIQQERLLETYLRLWREALCLMGHPDLKESILHEIGVYLENPDKEDIQRRCENAVATMKEEWEGMVVNNDTASIERFYAESQNPIYELMWWHTLTFDQSPLSYVTALRFAQLKGCRRYLDFGSGVGSGGLLFARDGAETTLADISSPLLAFCRWRFHQRKLPGNFIDLKVASLPQNAFDFITAMDVFEHLVDPRETAERLWQALMPGGYLFARLGDEEDEDRPEHIVHDFGPTFERFDELGLVQVWQDEWLWGHQVFQKT